MTSYWQEAGCTLSWFIGNCNEEGMRVDVIMRVKIFYLENIFYLFS